VEKKRLTDFRVSECNRVGRKSAERQQC
jgi:hypothetical protein